MGMRDYRAVCFDFDYTLGDATESIVAGFRYGLTRLGWPDPDPRAVRATVGYLLEDAYTMLTGDRDPARQARFRTLFLEAAEERQRWETKLFPGAVELLRGLRARGVKTAVISAKQGSTIEEILRRWGVLRELEFVIGCEHVRRPKPDPQGLLDAMGRLGTEGRETLFCGDTVLDAGAARGAGCDFAAVLLGVTPADAFRDHPCAYTASDLWSLADWLGL